MPRTSTLLAVLALLTLGCSGDSNPPDMVLTGSFHATVLIISPPGQQSVDVIQAGGHLHLAIALDSTVIGHLLVPSSITGDEPLDADLTGIATIRPSTVMFQHTADTFVRDLSFIRHDDHLRADQTLANGTHYSVRLELSE
jgi:hypothetical protein